MTAPAEDPRGGEAWPRGRWHVPDGWPHHADWPITAACRALANGLNAGTVGCRCPALPPAAGRGDTDSSGEGFDLAAACEPVARSPKSVRRFIARPAGDRAQPTEEPGGNDVAVEDVRAIAVALGLGGHARPYSAHEVVRREILPALAALLDVQAKVERVEALCEDGGHEGWVSTRAVRRALDGA